MMRHAPAALLALLPLAAAAAPVASPVIDVPAAAGVFAAHDGAGDLLALDAPAAGQGLGETGGLLADLSLVFDLADPRASAQGLFALRSEGDRLVEGALRGIAAHDGILTLVFDGLSGSIAPLFGDSLSMTLVFLSLSEADPLAALRDGETYDIAYWVEPGPQPAPVPLPAGALLLVSGLGLLVLRRRAGAVRP